MKELIAYANAIPTTKRMPKIMTVGNIKGKRNTTTVITKQRINKFPASSDPPKKNPIPA